MRKFAFGASGSGLKLVLAGLGAAFLAGCADSDRVSDPFSNPFSRSADQAPTGTTNAPRRIGQARPPQAVAQAQAVQSSPLAAPSFPSQPAANYSAPAHPSPKMASAAPVRAPEATSSLKHSSNLAGWSAEGGTPVVVARGETAESLSQRYGIPRDAILQTNGFASPAQVAPGTRVIIPVYNAALAASSGAKVAKVTPAHEPAAPAKFVKGAQPVKTAAAEKVAMPKSAKAPPAQPQKGAKVVAEKIAEKKVTEKKVAEAVPAHPVKPVKAEPLKAAKAEPVKVAKVEPAIAKKAIDPTPTASLPPENVKAAAAPAAGDSANPEFRWPARGRVIQGFKNGGNDGINIAVPEGTAVKAAESGVVAYAGSELKGYGNLVLIRHPNGFVTAYANNGDLQVKRGETVKRGQTIAKSGQSGNVNSPQLHFELRKGSTPVDPTQYLAGL